MPALEGAPSDAAYDLTVESPLERRPGVGCAVELTEQSANILFAFNEVKGPRRISQALEFIRDHRRFRPADLPGLADDASRLVLARRLLREGLLRVSAGSDGGGPAVERWQSGAVNAGSLVIVGSGIKSLAHLTIEAEGWIRKADVVLYCVSDPATEFWIRKNRPESIDLRALYSDHLQRTEVYDVMVERLLGPVRQGKVVCAVFYGHPGLFVMPTHRAIERARAEGYSARMLPGVSAADCLYADLGFDPAESGAQFYDATDLLLHRRVLHPDNSVVLWQIGTVGNPTSRGDASKLPILIEYLEQFYDRDCEVVHYQGSVFTICEPVVERISLCELGIGARVTNMSTLYIPAQKRPAVDAEMARRLGLAREEGAAEENGSSDRRRPPVYRPVPERSSLAEFVLATAADPALLTDFETDSQRTASRVGLESEELRALLTRMPGRIWTAITQGSTRDGLAIQPSDEERPTT